MGKYLIGLLFFTLFLIAAYFIKRYYDSKSSGNKGNGNKGPFIDPDLPKAPKDEPKK